MGQRLAAEDDPPRMFLGDPPGLHDRILDVSTAVTGATFFVPPLHLLEALADDA